MNEIAMVTIKKVTLKEHHLSSDPIKQILHYSNGVRFFPPFTSLAIIHYEKEPGYCLIHICDDSLQTDTWHKHLTMFSTKLNGSSALSVESGLM
jgi:hypothetical protein